MGKKITTEADFHEAIRGKDLSPEEQAIIRHDCNLPDDPKLPKMSHDSNDVFYRRLWMLAWSKMG